MELFPSSWHELKSIDATHRDEQCAPPDADEPAEKGQENTAGL
jgi:hypothetical protein